MWEKDININEVKEIISRAKVYFGVGAMHKIDDILKDLKSKGADKVIVISGRNAYKATGAWDIIEKALKDNNVGYVNYDKVTPNPTTDGIDEAKKIALDFGAKAVIAIGGGSPIDTGKSVAVLMDEKYQDKTADELYEYKFAPESAVPVVAINLTHGTGTEANRFAVATVVKKDFKPAIAYDCIYPSYSIDDPAVCVKLSPKQTMYTSIDAVNHVIEAATSKVASPYSISIAKETIRLVAKYLPLALKNPDDLEARYFLMYAALLGGICFDNGLLHYTHALEHPLSAVKHDLSHGLGLAILLPAVIETIYPDKAATLADILEPIAPDLKGEPQEAQSAAIAVEKWLFETGVKEKLEDMGYTESDVEKLTNLAFTTPSLDGLLAIAPNEATKERVEAIYRKSMKPMS
ncbi:TPA: iron-containing alcohol dehydrogenase [Candidatus Galligastranaerophilus faecipullorum]|nr:iron-containing alcohol dehydrogenase [Candidatus Galligastranaerophilus faecipullorum]